MDKVQKKAKKVVIGIAGGIVLLIGIIAIPYPGPGWLIVFAGLAILSTEFEWAGRLLTYARGKYDEWTKWLKNQSPTIRALVLLATSIVVVVTIWLLNGFGILNNILGLPFDWAQSPFVK